MVDNRSTVAHYRRQLSNLDDHMVNHQSDITAFHDYLQEIITNLEARGECSDGLMVNLF